MDISIILMVLGFIIAVIDIQASGYLFPFAMALFFTGVISLFIKSKMLLYILFGIQVILYYGLFILWVKKYKVKIDEEKIGYVKRIENGFYIVDFPTGYKGEIQWKAISDQPLEIGDKVKVKDIDGNILIVEKV